MSVVTVVEIGELVSLQKWLGLPLSDPIVVDCETGMIWIQAQKHEGEGPLLVFLNSGPDAFDQCVTEMRRVGAIGERRRDISAEECRLMASNLRALDLAIFGFEAHR